MKRILLIVAAVAAIWAVWWPLTAWREAADIEGWFEARRDAGWQADLSGVDVSGFPLAYIRRVEGPELADPATGWAWSAPELTIARPRHPELSTPGTTVVFPATMEIRTPWQRIAVAAASFDATLAPEGKQDRLTSATLEVRELDLRAESDWRASLASGRLSALALATAPEVVEMSITATGIVPPARIARALSDAELAPEAIERLAAEAEITFDKPWDRTALEETRPQPRRVVLKDAGLTWGQLTLRIAGTLDVDAEGMPEGELLVKATNWRELLAAARASGALPDGIAGAIEGALDLASRLAGSPATLDVPIGFSGGRTRLGPVPIGPAPSFRLP